MAKDVIKIKFVATELRDVYNCQNFSMREPDVLGLDDDDPAQVACATHLLEEHSDNFEDVSGTKTKVTVRWADLPLEIDPAKEVESFLVRYRTDASFRRQANNRGIRVLDMGEEASI